MRQLAGNGPQPLLARTSKYTERKMDKNKIPFSIPVAIPSFIFDDPRTLISFWSK